MYKKLTILLVIATNFFASTCLAGMTIGSGNNRLETKNLFKVDIVDSCTKHVQRTISDTVRGLGCSLEGSSLNINYLLSAQGVLELQNDKAVEENLSILAAELKKNTCLHPETFSNGNINRVKYVYVGPDRSVMFSMDVTKSDCAIKSFRNN